MGKVSQAYEKLVEIERTCRNNAVTLPEQHEFAKVWSGVGFMLNSYRFVAPMSEVTEILTVPKVTQVPGVGGWVKGVANVRGRLLPILDLMGFFYGKVSKYQLKRRKILIIEYGDFYSGLVVDSVFGMQHFPLECYIKKVDHEKVDSVLLPYVNGMYKTNEKAWPVFCPLRLTQDPKFLKLAS